MSADDIERRACSRFKIPGTILKYKLEKTILSSQYEEEFCPVLDISRGGLRFLCQEPIQVNSRITMELSIPGENIPLSVKGSVLWSSVNDGKNYKYRIGVQFSPYGEKERQNYPGTLVKIIALEQKFSPEDKSSTKTSDTGSFEIDG